MTITPHRTPATPGSNHPLKAAGRYLRESCALEHLTSDLLPDPVDTCRSVTQPGLGDTQDTCKNMTHRAHAALWNAEHDPTGACQSRPKEHQRLPVATTTLDTAGRNVRESGALEYLISNLLHDRVVTCRSVTHHRRHLGESCALEHLTSNLLHDRVDAHRSVTHRTVYENMSLFRYWKSQILALTRRPSGMQSMTQLERTSHTPKNTSDSR